jgi:hypothetical protein
VISGVSRFPGGVEGEVTNLLREQIRIANDGAGEQTLAEENLR